MLPPFEIVARLRPIDLIAPGSRTPDAGAGPHPLDAVAPYVAATLVLEAESAGITMVASDGVRLAGSYADGAIGLSVRTAAGVESTHRSRRMGTLPTRPDAIALTLTGIHLTVWSRDGAEWVVRGRVGLLELVDTRDEAWLASLTVEYDGGSGEHGDFGQLGLRDTRVVTCADGTPYSPDGWVWLTATHAGPGFFDTAHTGVWRLEPKTLTLEHRAHLFFRRPTVRGVYGDHATHLVRDGDGWLVATSTWGDFDRRRPAVGITLARTEADLTAGRHVLDTTTLDLPLEGLRSRGQWDPHLVRIDETWHVGFASARKFFRFHPALATGPSLDDLALKSATMDRRATEGVTLLRLEDGHWRVFASDGRDGKRGQREQFPVFDLDLTEIGALTAPYPTNIPWPTLVHLDDGWLMATFNATRSGGRLPGYGTHGDLVVMRERR
ncbi:hypothetical protein [Nocardioides sp. InS609-2]|uniref:hypothetical protein n=1 Tax=Nocardioides sp. InS609-2 TaxID=2760705 RepID=UPI0020C0E622|nr:hypothetical protein [Nocardioides sp. InS609-2]